VLDSELLCVHNHEKAKYVNLCNESDIGLMDRGEYKFIVAINEWIWVNVRVMYNENFPTQFPNPNLIS